MGFSVASILILFAFISFILLLLGSIKLIAANNIPGSKLIFIAVIGSIVSAFLPEAESDEGTISMLWQYVEIGVNSILMLMVSYGFYLLSSYVAKNSANKGLNSQPSAAGTPQSGAH